MRGQILRHSVRFPRFRPLRLLALLIGLWAPPVLAANLTFINPGFEGERFWDMTTATARAAAAQLGHDLEVLYADRDRYRMRELGLQVVARETPPDALILVNEEQFATDLLPLADEAGIPTLLLLNDIVGADRERLGEPGAPLTHWLGAIEPNNRSAGRRMADRAIAEARSRREVTPETPLRILALGGDSTTPASLDRKEGLLQAVADADDVMIDRLIDARWRAEQAQEITARYLDLSIEAPDIIWCANDEICVGAIAALEAARLRPGEDVVLVGLNWSPEGLDLVESGAMLLTDGGHFLAGGLAVAAVDAALDGVDISGLRPSWCFNMAAIDNPEAIALVRQVLADPSRLDYRRVAAAIREGHWPNITQLIDLPPSGSGSGGENR